MNVCNREPKSEAEKRKTNHKRKPISFSFLAAHFCEQVIQSLPSVFHISFWFCFLFFGFQGAETSGSRFGFFLGLLMVSFSRVLICVY